MSIAMPQNHDLANCNKIWEKLYCFPNTYGYVHAGPVDIYNKVFNPINVTIQAQKVAQENVKKFLEKRRTRNVWDRISTVFQFHRDEHKLVVYSPLYELTREDNSLVSISADDRDGSKNDLSENKPSNNENTATNDETTL